MEFLKYIVDLMFSGFWMFIGMMWLLSLIASVIVKAFPWNRTTKIGFPYDAQEQLDTQYEAFKDNIDFLRKYKMGLLREELTSKIPEGPKQDLALDAFFKALDFALKNTTKRNDYDKETNASNN